MASLVNKCFSVFLAKISNKSITDLLYLYCANQKLRDSIESLFYHERSIKPDTKLSLDKKQQ